MYNSPTLSENKILVIRMINYGRYSVLIDNFLETNLTCIVGKPIATRKLAHQLMRTATDMAAGRGPWKIFG